MPKVVIIQQVYKSRKWLELVYPAIARQTFTDIRVVCQIVEDDGGCEEYIRTNFPEFEILKPGYNIGFAKGHNEIFAKYDCEFFQLVNPDLIMSRDYVEKILEAFTNPVVGAATGKLLRYDFAGEKQTNVLDTTGVVLSRNGRGRDRGQHEIDQGQYDQKTEVVAVSGAGPMYRKTALEAVKMQRQAGAEPNASYSPPTFEYFDEDFGSYWEDVDLSLRLQHVGFKQKFVPGAIAWHGRTASSSKSGYKRVDKFVKHHKNLSTRIKQLNYKNHIFMVLKNFPRLYWQFFFRDFFMLGYILLFEPRTLRVVPEIFRQLKGMLAKREHIQNNSRNQEWVKLLGRGLLS